MRDNVHFRIDQARRTTGRVHSTGTVYLQYARARGHVAATMCVIQMQDECAPS